MNVQCSRCGQINGIPDNSWAVQYRCYNCGAFLPQPVAPNTDASQAVGLIGGAALGAAIGGPVGALIGAVIGAMIGREAKTNG
jgi:outer membrane lipoprotein SlyB